MTVAAVEVAEVAEVDLQGLQAFKRFVLRIYRLQAILEGCWHEVMNSLFAILFIK